MIRIGDMSFAAGLVLAAVCGQSDETFAQTKKASKEPVVFAVNEGATTQVSVA